MGGPRDAGVSGGQTARVRRGDWEGRLQQLRVRPPRQVRLRLGPLRLLRGLHRLQVPGADGAHLSARRSLVALGNARGACDTSTRCLGTALLVELAPYKWNFKGKK